MQATVIRTTGLWYTLSADNEQVYQCRIKGAFRMRGIKSTNPVAVGDRVLFELDSDGENGVIYELLPRRNFIVRRSVNLSKKIQILAANIDLAFVVVTIDFPQTTTSFIDRILATAQAYNIEAVLIFNKIDLYNADQTLYMDALADMYQGIGYQSIKLSASTGENIDALKAMMKGKTSMFMGHSGAGKSSLVNIVEPTVSIKTANISLSHAQGQHTTTFAQMHPLSFGGYVVDTPGVRGFGVVDMSKEEVGDYFPEIFALKDKCKFNNCLHLNEPGCAVLEALENEQIPPTRYYSYIGIIEGDEGPYREDIYK